MFQNGNTDSGGLDFWFPGKDSNDSLEEWRLPLESNNFHNSSFNISGAYPKPLKVADWVSSLDAKVVRLGSAEQKEEWTLQSESTTIKVPKGRVGPHNKGKKTQMDFERGPMSAKKSNITRLHNQYKGPSVPIEGEWKLKEEMEFTDLQKVQIPMLKEHEVLHTTSHNSRVIDSHYERINLKRVQQITSGDFQRTNFSLFDDHFVQDYIATSNDEKCIFLTDNAASLIMSATRTIFPWDLNVAVINGNIFIENRTEDIPYLPVNENTNFMSVQGSYDLSIEVNNFLESFIEILPLEKKEEETSDPENKNIYKYLKWDIIDGLKVIIRCRQHASTKIRSGMLSILFHVFIDSHGRWGNSMDNARGAILAVELRNNASSISRAIYNAILGDINQISLLYITREIPSNTKKHLILGCQFFNPVELSEQVNLNILNGFGILKSILETIILHASDIILEGKEESTKRSFVLLREPNKPLLLLYEK